MQEKHLYEYAVIRVVPRVEREEFINVGVVVFCAKKKFLKSRIQPDFNKLAVMSGELEIEVVQENLKAF